MTTNMNNTKTKVDPISLIACKKKTIEINQAHHLLLVQSLTYADKLRKIQEELILGAA